MTSHVLIVGAQRCGTTGLAALLDAHPEVTTARPAHPEPKVFLSAELSARGVEWYDSTYFSHASTESLLVEKSTSYLEYAAAAQRAAAMLGDAQIVVQLRDPVARAVSNWRFSSANGLEERPLARALEENLRGPRAWDRSLISVSPFAYLERGHYADYLGPWLESFPGGVHVWFLEDLASGRRSVADIYRSLGADQGFRPPSPNERINASAGGLPALDETLLRKLRDYFRPGDERLAELLGRELPWSKETDLAWRR